MLKPIFFVLLIIFFSSQSVFAGSSLSDIIPDVNEMPDNLKIAPIPQDGFLPSEANSFPVILDDTQFIDMFAGAVFGGKFSSAHISEVALIAYEGERNVEEIGIFVFKFKDLDAVAQAGQSLRLPPDAGSNNNDRFSFLERGEIFVFMFNDNLPGTTFDTMTKLVHQRLQAFQ